MPSPPVRWALSGVLLCGLTLFCAAQTTPGTVRSRADSVRKAKEYFINGTTLQIQGGRAAEAILEFQQALRFDTTSACLAAISRCYVELGKLQLAHEYVTLALERNKTSTDGWELLAEIEVQRGRYDEGLQAYEQILKLNPSRRHRLTLARLYEPRDARRAIEIYENLIESRSEMFVLERLMELYQRLNDNSGLLRTYSRAAELEPSNPRIAISLAFGYVGQGMFDELGVMLSRWTDRDPEVNGAARVWLAALSAMFEDSLVAGMYPERVLELVDESFRVHSAAWPVMCLSGALAGSMNDTIRMVRHLNAAVASPDAIAETYLEAFRLSMLYDLNDRATGYVRQGQRRFPGDIRLLYAEASIHHEQGNDEAAIAIYRSILEVSPIEGDAWSQLGFLYDRNRRTDSSDACYEKALSIDPRNPFVCNNYAYSLCLRGTDLPRALQLSQISLEIEPENPAYLDTYAWILFHLKRYDQAEQAAKSAIAFGGNATHYEHYGQILEAMGQTDAAVNAWRKALELDPKRTHLQTRIDRYR
ncbi:MAG TPA: hypothetical protein DCZ59_07270 [Bacteroidetes bacterium]|nr:hypothetical protein [Bacteroidota bacterium]